MSTENCEFYLISFLQTMVLQHCVRTKASAHQYRTPSYFEKTGRYIVLVDL